MTPFNLSESSIVTAGVATFTKDSPIVPNGKNLAINTFRGCCPDIGDGIDGIMVLQWGTVGSFVELAVGCHQFDYLLKIEVQGNASKFLRLLRFVPASSSDRRVFAQVRGVFG